MRSLVLLHHAALSCECPEDAEACCVLGPTQARSHAGTPTAASRSARRCSWRTTAAGRRPRLASAAASWRLWAWGPRMQRRSWPSMQARPWWWPATTAQSAPRSLVRAARAQAAAVQRLPCAGRLPESACKAAWRTLVVLHCDSDCGACAGPAKELRALLQLLQADDVFVKELDTKGMAFHSPALLPTLLPLRTGRHPAHVGKSGRMLSSNPVTGYC